IPFGNFVSSQIIGELVDIPEIHINRRLKMILQARLKLISHPMTDRADPYSCKRCESSVTFPALCTEH
ncbi:MAG: hypothetical protein ACJ75J_06110, partial [Cytophagaceae bacterium]